MSKNLNLRATLALGLIFAFLVNTLGPLPLAQAQIASPVGGEFRLPVPGVMMSLSPEFTPAQLKGIVVHPENPLMFDFIVDRGDKVLSQVQKSQEYKKLIKYFLASLAIPDEDQWVNLSPYEKNRIIKDDFGKTLMGRDLLSQDYILKQITASLIYPEDSLGKKFWSMVYTKAQAQYGRTNVPVNTFNKVWIVPDNAELYEKGNAVFLIKSHLKVMMEEDYLALQKHNGIQYVPEAEKNNPSHAVASKTLKEIIIPEIEKEVNEGKNFANLRQAYSGMILAAWYKRALKKSLLGVIYANRGKIKGVDQDPRNNEAIYERYLQAYKKGVFNYIKEDIDRYTNEVIPRKYFSGGLLGLANFAQIAQFDSAMKAEPIIKTKIRDEDDVRWVAQRAIQVTKTVTKRATADAAMTDYTQGELEEQLQRAPQQMILDQRFSDRITAIVQKKARLDTFIRLPEIKIGQDSYKVGRTEDDRLYMVGPLVFPTIYKLKQFDFRYWPQIYRRAIDGTLHTFGDFYKGLRHNIFFVPPVSVTADEDDVEGALDAHTILTIAAMLHNAEMFKGATVIDIGSGYGLLSLIALSLGAKKVNIFENNPGFNAIARAQFESLGWRPHDQFSIYLADMSDDRVLHKALNSVGKDAQNVIVLDNTGMTYSDLNDKSLRFANQFSDLRLVINAGHYVGNVEKKSIIRNQEVMQSAENIFREGKLHYERIGYFPNGNEVQGAALYIAKPNRAMTTGETKAPKDVPMQTSNDAIGASEGHHLISKPKVRIISSNEVSLDVLEQINNLNLELQKEGKLLPTDLERLRNLIRDDSETRYSQVALGPNGEVIGFRFARQKNGDTVRIVKGAFRAGARFQGLNSILRGEFLEQVARNRVQYVEVQVAKSNPLMKDILLRNGFKIVGQGKYKTFSGTEGWLLRGETEKLLLIYNIKHGDRLKEFREDSNVLDEAMTAGKEAVKEGDRGMVGGRTLETGDFIREFQEGLIRKDAIIDIKLSSLWSSSGMVRERNLNSLVFVEVDDDGNIVFIDNGKEGKIPFQFTSEIKIHSSNAMTAGDGSMARNSDVIGPFLESNIQAMSNTADREEFFNYIQELMGEEGVTANLIKGSKRKGNKLFEEDLVLITGFEKRGAYLVKKSLLELIAQRFNLNIKVDGVGSRMFIRLTLKWHQQLKSVFRDPKEDIRSNIKQLLLGLLERNSAMTAAGTEAPKDPAMLVSGSKKVTLKGDAAMVFTVRDFLGFPPEKRRDIVDNRLNFDQLALLHRTLLGLRRDEYQSAAKEVGRGILTLLRVDSLREHNDFLESGVLDGDQMRALLSQTMEEQMEITQAHEGLTVMEQQQQHWGKLRGQIRRKLGITTVTAENFILMTSDQRREILQEVVSIEELNQLDRDIEEKRGLDFKLKLEAREEIDFRKRELSNDHGMASANIVTHNRDSVMKGGIDLNSVNLAMMIKRDGKGVVLPLNQQDLAQLSNIEGLDPVILSIKPASETAVFAQLVAH